MGQSSKLDWAPVISKEHGPPTSNKRRFKSIFFQSFSCMDLLQNFTDNWDHITV